MDTTTDYLIAVGKNIAYHRKKCDMSLQTLGDQIGIDRANMLRIERGKNITLLTMIKIAVILGVKPSELLRTSVYVTKKDAVNVAFEKKNRIKKGK